MIAKEIKELLEQFKATEKPDVGSVFDTYAEEIQDLLNSGYRYVKVHKYLTEVRDLNCTYVNLVRWIHQRGLALRQLESEKAQVAAGVVTDTTPAASSKEMKSAASTAFAKSDNTEAIALQERLNKAFVDEDPAEILRRVTGRK